jgi:hypothetical protein
MWTSFQDTGQSKQITQMGENSPNLVTLSPRRPGRQIKIFCQSTFVLKWIYLLISKAKTLSVKQIRCKRENRNGAFGFNRIKIWTHKFRGSMYFSGIVFAYGSWDQLWPGISRVDVAKINVCKCKLTIYPCSSGIVSECHRWHCRYGSWDRIPTGYRVVAF